ncbi:calponin homology domain-containing protein DDB_G0272472-like isoform X1 [Astyanax mexicanus]|uniref:calponin homology domain-containing protein DDB_G0272472-like isoform X1 n=1 Tax=Astyanax mexicanus TaxID=7994 RepID=UPI0020CB5A3E|nr:calponin homology domain-containing protein DDB_G0272472-like isoform X1 [Astyanax mexicanus]XP_049337766.1 calponin homology domain-containing protein DDB_G0272472-like isoform X1 [Astyanax mexicanus]XP_049337767.1 calponin homology domain-containing protein DDB_G0272472-like isoform X1 [Astyanax mexicanus]
MYFLMQQDQKCMSTESLQAKILDIKKFEDTDSRIKESHMARAKVKFEKTMLSLDIEAREIERKIEMMRLAEERKLRAEQLQRKKMEKVAQQKALGSLITATRRRSRCESEMEANKAAFTSKRCDVKRECIVKCKTAEKEAKQVLAELLENIKYDRKAVKNAIDQIKDESEKQQLEDTLKEVEKEYKHRVKTVKAVLKWKCDMVKREAETKLLCIDAKEMNYKKQLRTELYEIGEVIKKGKSWEIGQKANVKIPAAVLEKLERVRSESLAKIEEQRKIAADRYEEMQRKHQENIKKEWQEAKRKVKQEREEKEKRQLEKLLAQEKKGKEVQEAVKRRLEKAQDVIQKKEEEWQAEVKRREKKRDATYKRINKEQLEYKLRSGNPGRSVGAEEMNQQRLQAIADRFQQLVNRASATEGRPSTSGTMVDSGINSEKSCSATLHARSCFY